MTVGDRGRELCLTVLGSGKLRPFPGTWGSLVAVLLFLPAWWLGASGLGQRWPVELILVLGIVGSSALSVRFGGWGIAHFGAKDPKSFVLDEFAGQWVALVALPVALTAGPRAVFAVILGQFLLFRVLDILKPPPAAQLEALPAGWGVLADDLAAGLYANLLGQLLWRYTPLAARLGL